MKTFWGKPMSNDVKAEKCAPRESQWLLPEDWAWVQMSVPIVCVDIMPIRLSRTVSNRIKSIGLISRITQRGTLGWCLIGGRLLYGESLVVAIRRQVKETLGNRIRANLSRKTNPAFIAQYFPSGKHPFCLDPRQHSVGLTYAVELEGIPSPRGEASAFEWFGVDNLPSFKLFGFNQDRIVKRCLESLRENGSHSQRD